MIKHLNIKDFLSQSANCIEVMMSSYRFFINNRLWTGFFKHKWMALATLVIAVLFSYWMVCDVAAMLSSLGSGSEASEASMIGDGISDEDKKEYTRTALNGGSKYVLMILLEIVIFHFSIRTIDILSGSEMPVKLQQFWKAELRMIHVLFRGFVQALIAQVVVSVIFGVLGAPDFAKRMVMFFVYAYFIGHAFFDNYNELHKIQISKSERITQAHFGATLTLGVVASTLLMIPIIGAIVTPIFGAISANIYGYQFALQHTPVPESQREIKKAQDKAEKAAKKKSKKAAKKA